MDKAEERSLRAAHYAVVEATRRARLRGLTADELEREGEDDDSQYWEDVRLALRDYHAQKSRQ